MQASVSSVPKWQVSSSWKAAPQWKENKILNPSNDISKQDAVDSSIACAFERIDVTSTLIAKIRVWVCNEQPSSVHGHRPVVYAASSSQVVACLFLGVCRGSLLHR